MNRQSEYNKKSEAKRKQRQIEVKGGTCWHCKYSEVPEALVLLHQGEVVTWRNVSYKLLLDKQSVLACPTCVSAVKLGRLCTPKSTGMFADNTQRKEEERANQELKTTRLTQVEYNRRFLEKQRRRLLEQKMKEPKCSECGFNEETDVLSISRDNKPIVWSFIIRHKLDIQDKQYVLLCPTCSARAKSGRIDSRPKEESGQGQTFPEG